MRLVAYLRVSSEGQLDGYGLDVQERDCRRWARAHGHKISKVCVDEAKSGTLEAFERPGLSGALDALADGTAEGLLIPNLSRIARELHIQEAALAVAWKRSATVFSADQGEVHADDPDDPMRTAMRQMLGVFNQLDRTQIVKRLRDGRRAKAATGKKAVGGYAFGFAGVGKGRERDAGPNIEEQKTLQRIVELRQGGNSYRDIARVLDSENLKPRRAQSWSAMTVRNIATRKAS
jgi:DNA invertase Pin-like site-specific DNA recombinase